MVGHTYLHFKGGRYIVDTIGIDSEDPTNLKVVYHSILNPEYVWVRDYDMFTSPVDKVKYPLIKQEMRFMKII